MLTFVLKYEIAEDAQNVLLFYIPNFDDFACLPPITRKTEFVICTLKVLVWYFFSLIYFIFLLVYHLDNALLLPTISFKNILYMPNSLTIDVRTSHSF